MSTEHQFLETESENGHRWGKFTASSVLGGKDWEVCFNCGMIRRKDKKNSPCNGQVQVAPRKEQINASS